MEGFMGTIQDNCGQFSVAPVAVRKRCNRIICFMFYVTNVLHDTLAFYPSNIGSPLPLYCVLIYKNTLRIALNACAGARKLKNSSSTRRPIWQATSPGGG